MTGSDWLARRNHRALERLLASGSLPQVVWRHALRLRVVPDTPGRAVETYWRVHPLRADRLARALADRSGAPEGWTWRLDGEKRDGLPATFRIPPAPYREAAFSRGPGCCCLCGQPVFRFGWHRDLWDGRLSRGAWHLACVAAWKFWSAPSDHVRVLKRLQRHRCPETRRRLSKTAEVDHRIPLYRVWRERRDEPWPRILSFWGAPNLQVIDRDAHRAKCAHEAGDRARLRAEPPGEGTPPHAIGRV